MSGYPHTLRPELHKALKDAGIDFWMAQGLTFWNCKDGRECVAYGYQSDGRPRLAINVVGLTTPEQAIAATLGAGTCHDMHEDDGYFKCSECGGRMHGWTEDDSAIWFSRPRFCPNCGRRIVEVRQ